MVVQVVVDVSTPRVRRRDQGRHPETELPEVVEVVAAVAVIGHHGRSDVVEEAAPLVVHEDQRAASPLRRSNERAVDRLDEALPERDVAPGVVVGAERASDPGRDERDGGKATLLGVGEEPVHRAHEREHPSAPAQRDRKVREVLRRLDAGSGEMLEDRHAAVLTEVERMQALLEPLGLGRIDVLPVRERGADQ